MKLNRILFKIFMFLTLLLLTLCSINAEVSFITGISFGKGFYNDSLTGFCVESDIGIMETPFQAVVKYFWLSGGKETPGNMLHRINIGVAYRYPFRKDAEGLLNAGIVYEFGTLDGPESNAQKISALRPYAGVSGNYNMFQSDFFIVGQVNFILGDYNVDPNYMVYMAGIEYKPEVFRKKVRKGEGYISISKNTYNLHSSDVYKISKQLLEEYFKETVKQKSLTAYTFEIFHTERLDESSYIITVKCAYLKNDNAEVYMSIFELKKNPDNIWLLSETSKTLVKSGIVDEK